MRKQQLFAKTTVSCWRKCKKGEKKMKGVFYDFFGMITAGAIFLGGMYLAFVKSYLIVAVVLFAVAFALAAFVSCYDVIIIEENIKESKNRRKNYEKQNLGKRRVS